MPRQDKVVIAYEFFRAKATDQSDFTLDELIEKTDWNETSIKTYMSKKWRSYTEKVGNSRSRIFKVKQEFLRITQEKFLSQFRQSTTTFSDYKRSRCTSVVTYEFLLPLTKEDTLRKALDSLFFTDTIISRLKEIGLSKLEKIVPIGQLNEDEYYKSICYKVESLIGGYSINHVSGRFRAHSLMSRREAADVLLQDGRYLVDETTASVKFILPVASAIGEYPKDLDQLYGESITPSDIVKLEIRTAHALFFNIFVEGIVKEIGNEDVIWLIETTSFGQILYIYENQTEL
jgi:hypothetical protein